MTLAGKYGRWGDMRYHLKSAVVSRCRSDTNESKLLSQPGWYSDRLGSAAVARLPQPSLWTRQRPARRIFASRQVAARPGTCGGLIAPLAAGPPCMQ